MSNTESIILFMSGGLILLIYLLLQINIVKLENKLEELETYIHNNDPKYINAELSKLNFEIYDLEHKKEKLKEQLKKITAEEVDDGK